MSGAPGRALPKLVAVGMVFLLTASVFAAGRESDDAKAGLAILKILSYDRALFKERRNEIAIGVLIRESENGKTSPELQVFSASRKVMIKGRTIHIEPIPYSAETLETELAKRNLDVLYVSRRFSRESKRIASVARNASVATVTRSTAMVRAGLAVGVVDRDDALRIIVNLPAAQACGMDLSAQLLRIAEVLR